MFVEFEQVLGFFLVLGWLFIKLDLENNRKVSFQKRLMQTDFDRILKKFAESKRTKIFFS
ncbi:hypothetical protein LEP1GSC043_2890 [Leptospira weilii str. Ecochallenge]|uniref:Uncharacterized protein n=1 Tax=Leptospira weilii str. Ecochallenge TaxID=1049986 RepID=N1U1L5_9LEPT|nr:hypothetical protein LEP1GSC043_2890 [Leptospira weilii str. Ecochallenge]